ncbi:ATP-binding protein [Lentzea sp. NPDC058450]|uniref:HAMP domain-containing sensor histidine kinase n=1 Tax=Lentzea sp. NPDC058450 TaxID=3346505 RepID=UPI003653EA2B
MSRWTRTMRTRATVAAVAVVGVALIVGAIVLVTVVRANLVTTVRTTTAARASAIASKTAEEGTPVLPEEIPAGQFVQVLDDQGAVVASSPNAAGQTRLSHVLPGQSEEIAHGPGGDPLLAVVVTTDAGEPRWTVIVGQTLAGPTASTRLLISLLVAGTPALLALVGLTTWLVVGRSLAPVAAITCEVDAITATELHRRVPEPDTGDEIAQLARTMNTMLHRLQKASDSQRRFVSDASHELRTPVATIRSRAEVAQLHPELCTVTDLADPVQTESLHLQNLVEDLLLLARADESGLALRRAPVDLDDLAFAEAHRLRITTSLSVRVDTVSAGRVTGDPNALARVVRNLSDNAARHAKTTVAFTVTENNSEVCLTVDDDGPGIPVPERERVLERFVRLDDARARDHGGSGLGLAIVAEITAAHHGTVTISASPQGGTRVQLALPAPPDR